MNIAFIKTRSFIFALSLFIFTISIAIFQLNLEFSIKIILFSFGVVLYFFSEYYKYKQWTDKFKENEIIRLLSTAQKFSKFNQRIRSNIFIRNKKKDKYYIRHSYNMDTFDDKHIEIPVNLGCTGEAWRTKKQIWGDEKKIFSTGKYSIHDKEEFNKVPKDLKWICSTPIVDKKGEVKAVMNFDGDGGLNSMQEQEIKTHCQTICEELKNIVL